ncbi:replication initiation protein [Corynebacterium xerosis]|uniref:replication initiation protein n=1 Tax=Corynebacterium xerosis TaxID=1725 RepID=UPI00366D4CAB
MTTTERWGQMWLPLWPLASDDLKAGIYRTSRQNALGRRYIEANPDAVSNLLVVDIDHDDALMRAAYDREGWRPTAVVENPGNGHAHAVWALREPVTRTEYAHRAPLAFAAAVTEGLRRSVDGDAAYSGLMTKNPEHVDWHANWFSDELYDLGTLSRALDAHGFMPPLSWKRTRRRTPVGLGRNCALFESARTWAYREIRHHFGDPEGLAFSIHHTACTMNGDFSEPLPTREVDQIARSIHRWITTRSRMWADGPAVYEATFSTIQSARGRRSGEARRAIHDDILAAEEQK